MDQGTGGKPSYTIKASCARCKIPPDFTTSNRFFNVTGLSAYTRYDVRVFSINNVTAAIGFDKAMYNSTSVLTGFGLPSEVQNLAKRTNSDASVTIFWNEPLTKGGDDLRYFITVNDEKGMFTTKMEYTVKQDLETKKYTVSLTKICGIVAIAVGHVHHGNKMEMASHFGPSPVNLGLYCESYQRNRSEISCGKDQRSVRPAIEGFENEINLEEIENLIDNCNCHFFPVPVPLPELGLWRKEKNHANPSSRNFMNCDENNLLHEDLTPDDVSAKSKPDDAENNQRSRKRKTISRSEFDDFQSQVLMAPGTKLDRAHVATPSTSFQDVPISAALSSHVANTSPYGAVFSPDSNTVISLGSVDTGFNPVDADPDFAMINVEIQPKTVALVDEDIPQISYEGDEAPPSAPNNVKATQIGSKWILLEWMVPMDQGTGGKPSYTIKASCARCKIPPDFTTSNRFFNVTGLSAYTRYDVRVFSINNVTAAIGFDKAMYNSTSVLTGFGLPSEVQNLAKRTNSDASVTIFWNEPLTKGGDDLRYFVTVNDEKGMFTTKLKYTVKQDLETKKYTVSVKAHTSTGFSKGEVIRFEIKGKGKYFTDFGHCCRSHIVCLTLDCYRSHRILLPKVLFSCLSRRHPKHLQTVRLENGEVILPSGKGVQNFVNLTYQDLEDVVQQFANELDRGWIKLERLIGGGEFGDVYIGTMEKPSEKAQIVAVKTLKSNVNKKARDDFMGEAAYMGQFDDPNVIHLEGVVVKDLPILIVMEFMSNGSLQSFLQKNDDKFTPLQLLGMARGVASGMTYLSEKSYIHRDLAARNILVNDDMVCKVADFGMSRELSKDDTYDTTVLERLASGFRLPPPMSCPKVVHDLMLSCWHKDRVKRPKFKDIRGTIDKWIRSPELLKHEESVVIHRRIRGLGPTFFPKERLSWYLHRFDRPHF
eukprot:gene6976-12599_t